VLAGKIRSAQVKDRIVLIGTIAPSFHDYVLTPYHTIDGNLQAIPGVILQAQMVSQLVSAALDGRTLIRSWTLTQDALWVWLWATGGGLLVIWLRRPIYLLSCTGIAIAILSGAYLLLFQIGYWVPFVPAAIALVGTQVIVTLIIRSKTVDN
jgi:CHASE2 domain-containing sensor protein